MKAPKKKRKYKANRVGSKYKPELCDKMVEYFKVDPTKNEPRNVLDKRGVPKKIQITIANKMPTFGGFCEKIGLKNHSMINIWVKKYPDFAEAHARCKFYQREFIDYLTLNGFWDSRYSIYLSTHVTGRQVQNNMNLNNKVSGSVETVQRVINYPQPKAEGAPVGP